MKTIKTIKPHPVKTHIWWFVESICRILDNAKRQSPSAVHEFLKWKTRRVIVGAIEKAILSV